MQSYIFALPYEFVQTFGGEVKYLYPLTAEAALNYGSELNKVMLEWYQYLDSYSHVIDDAHEYAIYEKQSERCINRWLMGMELYGVMMGNHFKQIAHITNYHHRDLYDIEISEDNRKCRWIFKDVQHEEV